MACDNGSVAWVVIEPDQRLPAEAHGSVLIDAQLNAAGWQVQDVKDVILFAGLQGAMGAAVMVPGQGWASHLLCVRDRGEVVVTIPLGVEWRSALPRTGSRDLENLPALAMIAWTTDGG